MKKPNPLLKLGLSYFYGSRLNYGLIKTEHNAFGTFINPQTGNRYYLDSQTTNIYSMNYSTEQLRIDGSLIFRNKPQSRFSTYLGIGITAGFSIHTQTDITYDKIEEVETTDHNGYSSTTFPTFTIETETYRNKSIFGLSMYLPIGMDLRIGKKNQFWKRLHLFYELRAGINMTSIPELRIISNRFVQTGIGMKFSW